MANKKKITTGIIAGVTAVALALGGTFAWQSISQTALNEKEATINPGGRLHDDFDGTNKDVYVENFADEDIFARIRLSEYFEITMNKNTPAETTEQIIGSKEDLGDANFEYAYEVHHFGDDDSRSAEYWNWTFGGKTVYMPTFNKNKDSLVADINGTFENDYTDYVDYEDGDMTSSTAIYDSDSNAVDEVGKDFDNLDEYVDGGYIKTITEDHTAKETETAKFIGMVDWLQLDNNGEDTANYWVYDDDGWVYWSSPIAAGTATGLLLDGIELNQVMDDSYYYAINVEGQFITADDLGKDDNTGFYDPNDSAPTENALTLLKKIGVKVDNDTADDEEIIDYQTLALSSTENNTIALSSDLESNKPIKIVAENGDALSKEDVQLIDAFEQQLTEDVDYTFKNGNLKILKMTSPAIYVFDSEASQMAYIILPVNPDSDYAVLPFDGSVEENTDLLSIINLKVNQTMTLYLDQVGTYMVSNPAMFKVREYGITNYPDLDTSAYTFENNQFTVTDSSYVGKMIEVHYEEWGGSNCASVYFYILPEDN